MLSEEPEKPRKGFVKSLLQLILFLLAILGLVYALSTDFRTGVNQLVKDVTAEKTDPDSVSTAPVNPPTPATTTTPPAVTTPPTQTVPPPQEPPVTAPPPVATPPKKVTFANWTEARTLRPRLQETIEKATGRKLYYYKAKNAREQAARERRLRGKAPRLIFCSPGPECRKGAAECSYVYWVKKEKILSQPSRQQLWAHLQYVKSTAASCHQELPPDYRIEIRYKKG